MGLYQNTRGRVSNHAKARLISLNERFPVGSKCHYTNDRGCDEIVTVASPFCLIESQPMGMFKEKAGWVDARVRELAPVPWKPKDYS